MDTQDASPNSYHIFSLRATTQTPQDALRIIFTLPGLPEDPRKCPRASLKLFAQASSNLHPAVLLNGPATVKRMGRSPPFPQSVYTHLAATFSDKKRLPPLFLPRPLCHATAFCTWINVRNQSKCHRRHPRGDYTAVLMGGMAR